ncbi:MAG: TRAP transporter large permease [Rubrivivax sp.]|jgi:C4-dicarboxylate transporter DctM subunit|nr:TRAP transporter large permease [Rubrivivax sp.]
MTGVWPLLGLLLLVPLLLWLRQNMIVVLGCASAWLYWHYSAGAVGNTALDAWQNARNEVFLAIPLYVLAGNVMANGSIARRLIRVMSALTAPIPGGLALCAVLSCALFSAISGSSTVTMLAVGGVLFPALLKAGYERSFALGLLCAAGTLGIIIPPSIPMILYGIMTQVSITDLFKAGVLPGLFLALLLAIYAVAKNWKLREAARWDLAEIGAAFKGGVSALMVPVIILGGIYSGYFTATESAVVALFYAVVVDVFVHKQLTWRKLFEITQETVKMSGALFPMLIMAVSINIFLSEKHVPQMAAEWLGTVVTDKAVFLLAVNALLLVTGCLIDIGSAILLLSPLLAPMAQSMGMDPVHFAMIMLVNLEIGYLTPPMGLNLIVAAVAFRATFSECCKAVLPFIGILLVGLAVVVLWPALSLVMVR